MGGMRMALQPGMLGGGGAPTDSTIPGRAIHSVGGQQNLPSLFGGQQAGFGGFNAGMANQGAPWMQGMLGGFGGNNMYGAPVGGQQNPYSNFNLTALSPNQGLGQQSSQMGYLQDIASGQGAGGAINQTPAWQAMVNAQNYNVKQGADQLAEQFNNGGGLFSTAYGNAAGQYQEQARLGQNAQLTQAQTQALQQAMQNQFGAAGQLSNQGYGALSQLSNQGYGAAQQMAGYQYGAGQQLAGQEFQGNLQGNMGQMQNQLALQGLGLQGAGQLGNMYNQNLGLGNQLGNSQMLANQNQLTSAYQNWYNSQPQNNPLLSMMFAGATGYPQLQQSTYNPGSLGSLLSGAGALAGGAAMLSDRRLKENISRVGKFGDISLYTFNFPGKAKQLGVMAQQVARRHPEAVIRGSKTQPWLVRVDKLAEILGVR